MLRPKRPYPAPRVLPLSELPLRFGREPRPVAVGGHRRRDLRVGARARRRPPLAARREAVAIGAYGAGVRWAIGTKVASATLADDIVAGATGHDDVYAGVFADTLVVVTARTVMALLIAPDRMMPLAPSSAPATMRMGSKERPGDRVVGIEREGAVSAHDMFEDSANVAAKETRRIHGDHARQVRWSEDRHPARLDDLVRTGERAVATCLRGHVDDYGPSARAPSTFSSIRIGARRPGTCALVTMSCIEARCSMSALRTACCCSSDCAFA